MTIRFYGNSAVDDALMLAVLEAAGVNFDEGGYAEYEGRTTDPLCGLGFRIGNTEDFIVFDYLRLPGSYIALHSVLNCGSGNFVQNHNYRIVTRENARQAAIDLVGRAWDWLNANSVNLYVDERKDSTQRGDNFVATVSQTDL